MEVSNFFFQLLLAFCIFGESDLLSLSSSSDLRGTKGDESENLVKIQMAPKIAKSLLRVKRGWGSKIKGAIKKVTGEREEESEARQRRERGREAGERNNEELHRQRTCPSKCWQPFGPYGACSAPCGNSGIRMAYRSRLPLPASDPCYAWLAANSARCTGGNFLTEQCNRFCHNGGTAQRSHCDCPPGWKDTCCQTRVTCGAPEWPDHGTTDPSGGDFEFGTVVTYSCNVGYMLVGVQTRECLASGLWTDNVPVCQQITCEDPGIIDNGQREGDSFTFGSSIVFSCEIGYRLTGDTVRRCEGEGAWTGENPTCEAITCPSPEAPANGEVEITATGPVPYQQTATYQCTAGFHLIGPSSAVCTPTGEWSNPPPACQAIFCSGLPSPVHGAVTYEASPDSRPVHSVAEGARIPYGDKAVFYCEPGYSLEGDTERTCTSGSGRTGQWTGVQPTCQVISCGDPGTPDHGTTEGSTYTYNTTVSYNCLPGYTLGGSTSRACLATGEWTATLPVCTACPKNTYKSGTNQAQECEVCPPNMETRSEHANTALGQCMCIHGYRGPGGGPCEEVLCAELIAPPLADMVACSRNVDGVCTFTCRAGHIQIAGEAERVCGVDGQWSGTDLTCSACPVNTFKSAESLCSRCPDHAHTLGTANERAGCVCDPGFQDTPDGACADINECLQSNGGCEQICINTPGSAICRCRAGFVKDSLDDKSCVATVECPTLSPPDNGGLLCLKQVSINTLLCSVKCNPGFEHPTTANVYEKCNADTDWTWTTDHTEEFICIPELFPGIQVLSEAYYFVDSCEALDDEQLDSLGQDYIDILYQRGVCKSSGARTCDIRDIEVDCGVEAEPSYEEGSQFGLLRKRRSTQQLQLRIRAVLSLPSSSVPQGNDTCLYSCILEDDLCREQCTATLASNRKQQVEEAAEDLVEVLMSDTANLTVGDIVLRPTGKVNAGPLTVECEADRVIRNGICVQCDPGHHIGHHVESNSTVCMPCPIGTYQPRSGQTGCLACPGGSQVAQQSCPSLSTTSTTTVAPSTRHPFHIIVDVIHDTIDKVSDTFNPDQD